MEYSVLFLSTIFDLSIIDAINVIHMPLYLAFESGWLCGAGMYGVQSSAAIVLPPQACALSLGAVVDTVVPNPSPKEGEEIWKVQLLQFLSPQVLLRANMPLYRVYCYNFLTFCNFRLPQY